MAPTLPGDERVLGFLERRVAFGRSSRFGLRRHAIMREGEYEAILKSSAAPALKGRALRMLGRLPEAGQALDLCLRKRPEARGYAWRWELSWARKKTPPSFADIDRAIALEPRNGQWLAWRACGRLVSLPALTKKTGVAQKRQMEAQTRAAIEDAGAAGDCVLAHVAQALAWANLQRWEQSLRGWDAALALEPGEAWLYRLRGPLRWRLDDFGGYVADMDAAMLLEEKWKFPFESGPDADSEEQWGRELSAADDYLRRNPKAYWMYVFRGDCRRSPRRNDFTGAIADFEKAVSLKPDCAWAWAYLSRARLTVGEGEKARQAIEKAVGLAPKCGWMRIWRGEVKRRMGDVLDSLPDFDQGLELDPDYEFGYAWRGGAKRALGLPQDSLPDLSLATALEPHYPWSFQERSLALRALGRVGEALEDLRAAALQDPKYVWCSKPRDCPRALEELDDELRRHPRNPWALAWKGEIRLRMGDPAQAAEDLKGALRWDAKNAWARAWLGQALGSLGRKREAMAQLDRAIALDPRCAAAYAWRGRFKAEWGDGRAALKDLTEAARIDPTSSLALESKARAELSLGRLSEAADDYSRAIQLSGRNREALIGRAEALRRLGQRKRAARDLAEVARLDGLTGSVG
jgi:tetratricopeptide (TPR) repeat protein